MSNLAVALTSQTVNTSELNFADFSQSDDRGLQHFRDGMSALSASVNVITTLVDGQPAGFTATAVTSVTDTPPTLLVCLNRSSSVFAAFDKAEYLCVNTLAAGQEAVSAIFASKLTQEERFVAAQWHDFISGSPVLAASATVFDCRITSRVSVGTHDVFFCEVLGIGTSSHASNLVYFNRQYHSLT